jgi:hypothetical protein
MTAKPESRKPATAPIPVKRRSVGTTGEGSKSALDAMLKKRREGENQAAETQPPEGDDFAASET